MFKKIILSAVAIATLSTGVFAGGFNGQEDKFKTDTGGLKNWTRDKYERSLVCDDTSEAVQRTGMAVLKADIGDLTFSSVGRVGSFGVGKGITLNQICWKYYQEVEDSSDGEFKDLMNKFIGTNSKSSRNAIGLSFLYSVHNQPKQANDVLSSFAKGDIGKTKKLLEQYMWVDDLNLMTDFRKEADLYIDGKGGDFQHLLKVYENYKNRTYKSDVVASWMHGIVTGNIDEFEKGRVEIKTLLAE